MTSPPPRTSPEHTAELPEVFHPAVRQWFAETFDGPTPVQLQAWQAIARGASSLILAPTGSGKTLAAFLVAINRIMFEPLRNADRPGVRTLYISPLKALGVDVERNLRVPLAGVRAVAEREGYEVRSLRIGVRSGDTAPGERQQLNRQPPEILITTPESLYLMLTSKAREALRTVETVIIDEIHSLAGTKRGTHLFVSLERLERERVRDATEPETVSPLQRIGLSATQRPLAEIARLLGGGIATADPTEPVKPRPVEIIEAGRKKQLELQIEVPVEDMAALHEPARRPKAEPEQPGDHPAAPAAEAGELKLPSLWPALHPRLVELIRQHRSTMIFVNSRRLAERLSAAINELAEEEIAAAHHGSVARENRLQIEDRLKQGLLPAIVATSSLELGIDMGAVDLVIQIEAPSSIASGIQRIGRAGHQVGAPSRGVIFPKFRGDLLACSAAAARMQDGEVEQTFYPRNPLDVVAQQIVAMVALEPVSADDLYATLRSAAPCFELARSLFDDVLDLLSGRYPSDEFAGLRPRITWDRISGEISPRRGTQRIAVTNAGTIPDRGLYGVFLAEGSAGGGQPSRVGELDEEMVFEMRPGDVFLLGASSWRVLDITRDRVLVAPAPGESGRMPFWRGDGLGRPLEFGQAIGRLTRELLELEEPPALTELETRHSLDPQAARNLLAYLNSQAEATGHVPTDRTIVVESFVDEVGDWRVAVLTPFGLRVHTPWAMAIAARLREGMAGDNEIDLMWNDDGMVFRLPESDEPPGIEQFLFAADEIEPAVVRELGSTALFAARFRENAARALLLPRRSPGKRTPLWLQRRKSADLLNVAARYERFPMLLETYRECLRDVFDMAGLKAILRDVEQHTIQVVAVRTEVPSPFAASLLFSYTGNFLYNGDAPLAERRAAALSLDHAQLRELLGDAELRDLLDAEVIREYAQQLQRLDGKYPPAEADDLHELLRQLGDLTREELRQRCAGEVSLPVPEQTASRLDEWIDSLLRERRIVEVSIAGEQRLVAAEDAARVRILPEVELPGGLPAAFLEPLADAAGDLISRYARTHGPFQVEEPAVRLGISPEEVLTTLERLAEQGRVVDGEFLPGGKGREWCDGSVLRNLRQRSLARLRKQVEPVDGETFTKFLLDWQGIRRPGKSLDGLLDAIEQLQGLALPASDLERKILPARVEDYSPRLLDELCMAGEIVWRGVDPLGRNDGRIALYLTDDASQLLPPLEEVEDEYDRQLLDALASRGGLFFEELCRELGDFPNDVLQHLWRLVWAGHITNDTLTPLRSRLRQSPQPGDTSPSGRGASRSARTERSARPRRSGRREFRSRRTASDSLAGAEGRWSLASRHLARHLGETEETRITPTERLTAVAAQLIERYGIVTRELVAAEGIPGGFSALYPVFRAMEEAGRVRRGYFIAGQGAAQFAAPGADDRLRNQREPWRKQHAHTLVLAATDPASPFGSALKWPGQHVPDTADNPNTADMADDLTEPREPPNEQPADQPLENEPEAEQLEDDSTTEESSTSARPQRAAGAQVVIAEGQLQAWLSRSRKQLLTFLPAAEPEREQARQELLQALPAAGISLRRLTQLTIDGKPARESGLLPPAD